MCRTHDERKAPCHDDHDSTTSGITVDDLEAVTSFFVELGLEPAGGSQVVEGEFLDAVIGIDGARVEVVTLRTPDGGTNLELSMFLEPAAEPDPGVDRPHRLGLRNVCFEVDDVRSTVARLEASGFGLVGGVSDYEQTYRMCYVRGPEGIIVSLAESLS